MNKNKIPKFESEGRSEGKACVHNHFWYCKIRNTGDNGAKADVRITNKELNAVQACNNALKETHSSLLN